MMVHDTERLRFHLLQPPQESELLLELDSDPEVMRFINGGMPSSREDILKVSMPRVQKYLNPNQGWGIWMTTILSTGEFIGWILVRPMYFFENEPDEKNLEIGWRFKRSSWGHGYATEAASAVVQSLVAKGIQRFTAMADAKNVASINVMKKLGMQFSKEHTLDDGSGAASDLNQEQTQQKRKIVYYELRLDVD